jgi:hypothetical protein
MASSGHSVLKAWPAPPAASLTFEGRPAPGLKPGRPVSAGQLLAVSGDPWTGDLRAPFSGEVTGLSPGRIDLLRVRGLSGKTPAPADLGSLEGPGLASALKSLGADLPSGAPAGQPILISALSPEPGLDLAEALWLDQRTTLARGLAALARLWPGAEIVEVLPPRLEPLGRGRAERFKDPFPLTLPSFLRQKILGLPAPEAAGVVGPERLWALGTASRSDRKSVV